VDYVVDTVANLVGKLRAMTSASRR
jgi:hypothetical protein